MRDHADARAPREPYNRQLPELFDDNHGQQEIAAALPDRLSELVTDRFIDAFRAGEEYPAWFYQGLADAETFNYVPRAPLRVYYGSSDTIVVAEEATTAFEHMQSLGERSDRGAGPDEHDEMVVQALPAIQRWFDELDKHAFDPVTQDPLKSSRAGCP